MEKRRHNIGLLVANIMDPFSNGIAKGAMKAAEEYDVNLTIFPAKYIDRDYDSIDAIFEYQYNALLSYAATGQFDYLVVCVGTIGYASDGERKKEIIEIYEGTPVLCVSTNVPGYDYILYDNTSGVAAAVDYLVKEGRKHICMMVGDTTNYECQERLEAYRSTLVKNGMEYSDRHVMESDISERCVEETKKLLENNPEADAIICATDTIAATVCKVIKEQHKKVGEDIAVVGFDDQPFAAKFDPPLASIRADAKDLGYCSIKKAVNYLEGVPDEKHLIETTFIPRASCMYGDNLLLDKGTVFSGSCEEIAQNIIMYIFGEKELTDGLVMVHRFCLYIVSLVKERIVEGKSSEEDITYISRLLVNYFEDNRYQDDRLLKIVDVFEFACAWISDEYSDERKVEAMEQIRKLVYGKLMGGLISDLNMESNRTLEYAHDTNLVTRDTLMFNENLKKSYADILAKLYCLNIKRSYLYLLDEPKVYLAGTLFPLDVKWNFKSYQDGVDTYIVSDENQNIAPNKIYSNHYMSSEERHTFVVIDLYSREYQYGILLCEVESDEFFKSIEFIVYQLSVAVKTVSLLKRQEFMLNELHTKNLALEKASKIDELTGIYNRRGFYSTVNDMITKEENKGKELIVCYADMDNLKMVNDAFGHIEGDFSLKALAKCLYTIFGKCGVVGRMGGDEFAAVIVKDCIGDSESITLKKEELIRELNSNASKPYKINMSMGLYECICNNSYDLKEAIDKADDILYTIKVKRKKQI